MLTKILSPYIGTIVNFIVVLIMGTVGTFIKKGIPKKYTETIMAAMAVCVIYIGIDGMLEAAPPTDSELLGPGLFKVLVMIISMALGTLIGELIDLDGLIKKLGDVAQKKFSKSDKSVNIADGFVSCSILFCVGAMTVNGAIASAGGDHGLLLTKSVIDGVSALILASSLGIGCAFSAFFVLAYQGILTLLATFLIGVLPSAATLTYMSVTGSLVVLLLGTNVLGITRVRTANMVPSMFIAIGVEALLNWIF